MLKILEHLQIFDRRFPDVPHLPWDGAGADPVLTGERLAIRASILENRKPKAYHCDGSQPLKALGLRRQIFEQSYFTIGLGDTVERNAIVDAFMVCGYQRVDTVEDPGTFAVRGGIIDCFIPLQTHPIRIDLFGDEVDTIHPYHVETQRRGKSIDKPLTFFPFVKWLIPMSGLNGRLVH